MSLEGSEVHFKALPAPLPTEAASRKEILPSRTYYSDPEDAEVLKENEANAFSVRS